MSVLFICPAIQSCVFAQSRRENSCQQHSPDIMGTCIFTRTILHKHQRLLLRASASNFQQFIKYNFCVLLVKQLQANCQNSNRLSPFKSLVTKSLNCSQFFGLCYHVENICYIVYQIRCANIKLCKRANNAMILGGNLKYIIHN